MAANEENNFLNVQNLNDTQKIEIERIIDGDKKKEDKIKENIEEILENDKSKEINSISNKFTEYLSSELKDPSVFKVVCDELKAYITNTQTRLKDDSNDENKTDNKNQLTALDNAEKVVNAIELPLDLFLQVLENRAKYKAANEAIETYKEELQKLREKEMQVKQYILPLFQALQNRMKNYENAAYEETLITTWKNKNDLEAIKRIVDDLFKELGDEISEKYREQFQKLISAMNLISKIHKEINSYKGQSEMGQLISDLHKNIHYGKDTNLNNAMLNLEYAIKSNSVREKCEKAYKAYKQYNFPFAAQSLTRTANQVKASIKVQMEMYVEDAIVKFQEVMHAKALDESTHNEEKNSNRMINSMLTVRGGEHKPFCIWKYQDHIHQFKDLIELKSITLFANISDDYSLKETAVQFNQIGIYFRFADKGKESQFYNNAKHFSIMMTLSGPNYYRCGEHFYQIPLEKSFGFPFRINQLNKEIHFNPVNVPDDNLNYYFLSPFGNWQIELKQDQNSNSVFRNFADMEFDIELVGQGKYLESSRLKKETCNHSILSKFYECYDSREFGEFDEFQTIKNPITNVGHDHDHGHDL